MFDNLGTALVQAVGFFGVFGFFVYQLLTDSKKLTDTKKNSPSSKVNKSKAVNDKSKRNRLFGTKIKEDKEEVLPRKKGLFGIKIETEKVLEQPKKKGWFN